MASTPLLRTVVSCKYTGAFLQELAPVLASSDAAPEATRVFVNPHVRFQQMEGFGGAFTESAACTWMALGEARREELLHAYFDRSRGHGYRLCRVHMNSCDFSLGNYAHAEVADDLALEHFSIARDRKALLPFIQAAQRVAGDELKLLASPWSPPAWMKSNGQMNGGGSLLPQYRAVWAQYFVKFIEAYAQEGVPIWGVTVQNEPMAVQRWDSCIYTAEEERDFVRDFLGPALEHAGMGHVRIVIWDHNRDAMVERASVVLSDPMAARYVWGTGFHWYVEDHFEHVQLVHDAWPEKKLLFTEGCQEGGPHTGEWETGERYARSIIQDLNHWTVGWIDWNLLLDTSGGPNHVGNYCSAPMLADVAKDHLMPQSSYAALGHFARYVQPDARRVLCAATKEVIETTAFYNPDGSVVVVVLNRSENALSLDLAIGTAHWAITLPGRAMASYITEVLPSPQASTG